MSTVKKLEDAIRETKEFVQTIQNQLVNLKGELLEAIKIEKVVSIKESLPTGVICSISGNGRIIRGKLGEDSARIITDRVNFGNCFETEQEAIDYAEELRIITLLNYYAKKFNKGWKPDWNDDNAEKYFITLSHKVGKLEVFVAYTQQMLSTYFKSEEDLLQTIKLIGEDKIIKAWTQT